MSAGEETGNSPIHRTIDAVWRMESAKIIAVLARIVGEIELAEDLAQDALVIALERWPESGIPDKPGAWLMATAKHRAIDRLRRDIRLEHKVVEMGRELEIQQAAQNEIELPSAMEVEDDLLGLIFMTCHPILSEEARVALTLRLLGGLTTKEIARAFLIPEPTIAQRIVRAKRTLSEAHVPFDVPGEADRALRLGSVLEVLYLIFNEGYAATSGEEWVRPALCEDALRMGRILAELVPGEPEVHGLVALMEIQASRLRARVDVEGKPVLLRDQNRARWDRLLIGRGLSALRRAQKLGGVMGPYTLQAAIAACHAQALTPQETDWARIVALYDALAQLAPSPVVELNRAVAISIAYGAEAGLEIVEELVAGESLKNYHLLPAVHGDLLSRLGRHEQACKEFELAASLTGNAQERELLTGRALAERQYLSG